MKKVWMGTAAVALSGCLVFAFAGCGTVGKAKSMRGEEVTEDVWDAAMAGTAYATESSAALPVQTVADEAEAPNFKAEYEMKMSYSFSTEGGELLGQTIEAMNASLSMSASAAVTIADNIVHLEMDFSVKVDGSEELLALIDMDGATTEEGSLDIYISYADPVGYYIKDDDGNWVSFTAGGSVGSSVSEMAQSMSAGLMEMLDQSALAGAFAEYTYSAEKKGYVAADAELSGEAGDSAFSMGGELVYKIKDGKLGAIYAQASADAAQEDVVSFDTQTEMGLVYSYGGQSNTLPEVK